MKFQVTYADGTEDTIDFNQEKGKSDIAYTIHYEDNEGHIYKKEVKKGEVINVPDNLSVIEISQKKWVE
jgi:hypothetical protein